MAAGASSAVLSCPAELLMIQQQSTGESLAVAARRTGLRQLYRGLVCPGHIVICVHSCALFQLAHGHSINARKTMLPIGQQHACR